MKLMNIARKVLCSLCRTIPCLALAVGLFFAQFASAQTIIRVDGINGVDDPAGLGNDWGSSAFRDLQDALDYADTLEPDAPPNHVQIWVRGTTANPPTLFYKPDKGDNYADGSRTATFELRKHVGMYGGFAGSEAGTTAGFNSRNHLVNKTILSGDLAGNDDPEDPFDLDLIDDNSRHVVTAPQFEFPDRVDPTAILDGFIVTAGVAGDVVLDEGGAGGGLLIHDANPTILRCTFKANKAYEGFGGAVWSNSLSGLGQSPKFYNCIFDGNQAHWAGGAVHIGEQLAGSFGGYAIFLNCLFINNTVEDNDPQGQVVVGGAVISANLKSGSHLINCTATRNNALDAAQANAFVHEPGFGFENGAIQLYNTIVWNNDGATTFGGLFLGDHFYFDHSNVQATIPEEFGSENNFNINADPLFIDANDNFRLNCNGSQSIGAGYSNDQEFGQLDDHPDLFNLDQDIDFGEITPDLDYQDRVHNKVDQGCYEVLNTMTDAECAEIFFPLATPIAR